MIGLNSLRISDWTQATSPRTLQPFYSHWKIINVHSHENLVIVKLANPVCSPNPNLLRMYGITNMTQNDTSIELSFEDSQKAEELMMVLDDCIDASPAR